MIEEVKVADLQVGFFVVDIVEQTGNFQLTGAGHIKSDKVIQNLDAKGVHSVLIDTSKTIKPVDDSERTPKAKKAISLRERTKPEEGESAVFLEVSKAKRIFNESKEIQKRVFQDALTGREIDLQPVLETTDKTIDAIFKNPDALACIINIRKKDEYLLEHSVSVSILITIFARFLNVDRQIIHQLAVGAFLHDVGKIMISDDILNKPGKLTPEEFDVMKTHVNHSINIIENTAGISELSLEVAAQHHEKLDGSGYPFKLPGDDISMYGRMITICDIFDALTAHRAYKDGYSQVKAFSILRHLAKENHLDSALVDQFIKCMGVYPVGSLVELGSNKIAIVETRNQDDPIRPKVRSFYNANFKRYVMTEDIDLSKESDYIVKGVRADDFDLDMNRIIEFLLMEG